MKLWSRFWLFYIFTCIHMILFLTSFIYFKFSPSSVPYKTVHFKTLLSLWLLILFTQWMKEFKQDYFDYMCSTSVYVCSGAATMNLWPPLKQSIRRQMDRYDTVLYFMVGDTGFTHISSFLSQSPSGWCHILSETTAIVLPRKQTSRLQSDLHSEGQSEQSDSDTAVQQEGSLWRFIHDAAAWM